jgi:hypothetical protein
MGATVDVKVRPGRGDWEWRVIDGRGRLRLAGTHETREEAMETGTFWCALVDESGVTA